MKTLNETSPSIQSTLHRDSLDLIQTNSNTHPELAARIPKDLQCSSYLLVGPADENGLYPYLKIFCNRYGCSVCGKRKRAKLMYAIRGAIERHKLNVFATLTLDPRNCDAASSAKYIKATWNKHRTYQRRHFQEDTPSFVHILEFQKNGYAHLHVLLSAFIEHAWLKHSWSAVGGGTIVDVRKANQDASKYVSKYLTKALDISKYGRFRRVCTSRDIKLFEKGKNTDFKFLKLSWDDAKRFLKNKIVQEIHFGSELITGMLASRRLEISK